MSPSVPPSGNDAGGENKPHPMDPEPKDPSWRERLFHEDQEFPLTYTATQPDQAAAARAWEGTAHLDEFRALVESILEHESKEGALLVLADPDGVPAARAYAAVCLARLLAERGQRVLVAQTDVAEQPYLLENEFEEVEGFVDLVLYGVSPSITCRPTRLPRIDVLALGSFRPEPGNVYPEEELRRAFGQLRASYDVILMMATAKTNEGDWNALVPQADAVVLVTGVQRPEELESLRQYLAQSNVPVWGAVVFTSAAETVDLTVEEALEQQRLSRPVVIDAAPPLVIHEGDSSPLFRRVAVAIAVVLLGFVGWWAWTQFLRGDEGAEVARTPVVADAAGPAVRPVSPAPTTVTPDATTPPAASVADPSAPGEDTPTEEIAESLPEAPSPAVAATATDDLVPPEERTAPDTTTDEPVEVPSPRAVREPTPPPPDPVADRATRLANLLKRAPGGAYGLYVWSFPDSLEAEGALQSLRRDGFEPAVVAADIAGRGRWYRVVVGNFASRQDALDARDILTRRSDVDWAGLVYVN